MAEDQPGSSANKLDQILHGIQDLNSRLSSLEKTRAPSKGKSFNRKLDDGLDILQNLNRRVQALEARKTQYVEELEKLIVNKSETLLKMALEEINKMMIQRMESREKTLKDIKSHTEDLKHNFLLILLKTTTIKESVLRSQDKGSVTTECFQAEIIEEYAFEKGRETESVPHIETAKELASEQILKKIEDIPGTHQGILLPEPSLHKLRSKRKIISEKTPKCTRIKRMVTNHRNTPAAKKADDENAWAKKLNTRKSARKSRIPHDEVKKPTTKEKGKKEMTLAIIPIRQATGEEFAQKSQKTQEREAKKQQEEASQRFTQQSEILNIPPLAVKFPSNLCSTVRRYVYHDVVRLDDLEKLVDCSYVQPYTINSAKVAFLKQRPQSRPFKGSGNICLTCDRILQEPFHFRSLDRKVDHVVLQGQDLSSILYRFLDSDLFSRFETLQVDGPDLGAATADGQIAPNSILGGPQNHRGSSGGSSHSSGGKGSSDNFGDCGGKKKGGRRRKGAPQRSPLS